MADSATGIEGRNDSSAPGELEAAPTPNACLQVRRWPRFVIGTKRSTEEHA